MKNIKFRALYVTLLLIVIGCSSDLNVVTPQPSVNNVVNEETARAVATNYLSFMKQQASIQTSTEISKVTPIMDNQKLVTIYIVEFKNGGFAIVSAENKSYPILAYSEINKFPTENLPLEIQGMINGYSEHITNIRKSSDYQSEGINKIWSEYQTGKITITFKKQTSTSRTTNEDPIECGDTSVIVYPLMDGIIWDEYENFNQSMATGCPYNGGRNVAGSVSVAMGSIMKYWSYPSSYSWSSIPASGGGSAASALVKDAGDAVGTNYNCGISFIGSTDVWKIPYALTNTFGYSSSAGYTSYSPYSNYLTVENELLAGRPVIFTATLGKANGDPIDSGADLVYAWVCDGFVENSNNCPGGNTTTAFHFLWYYPGSDYDGNYGIGSPTIGSFNYNRNLKIVTNIHP